MLKKLKYWIKQFFYFSNRESDGLLALIILLLLLIIAPQFCKLYYRFTAKPLDHNADIALLEEQLMILKENSSKVTKLNINTATIQMLVASVGLSEKLATRVIRYRDKLGGFIALEQYKEIYGLSSFLQLRLMQQTTISKKYRPRQLSLNRATFKELIAHPYISPVIAKSIINYRQRKEKFIALSTIRDLPGFYSDLVKKIIPYLTL